jgi:hypothetical protein
MMGRNVVPHVRGQTCRLVEQAFIIRGQQTRATGTCACRPMDIGPWVAELRLEIHVAGALTNSPVISYRQTKRRALRRTSLAA